MATVQKYGIKYPFSSDNNDEVYVDLNESYLDSIKSQVLHILFTPKGQRIRDPKFGTDLVKYIFEPNDSSTWVNIENSIRDDVSRYLTNVTVEEVSVIDDEGSDNSKIIMVTYKVTIGNSEQETTVAVKI